MKPIVVKDQVRLGPARCLSLSISGMYYRLTRSAITVLILALAVAFLAYILFYGILSHDTEYHASGELQQSRIQGEWASRLTSTDGDRAIMAGVVAGHAERLLEYQRWNGTSGEEFSRFEETTRKVKAFVDYFAGLSNTSRAVLIADVDPFTLAERLGVEKTFDGFVQRVGSLSLRMPLGSANSLREFATADFPFFQQTCRRIQQAQNVAIDSVKGFVGERDMQVLFAAADTGLRAALVRAGYALTDGVFGQLSEAALLDIDIKRLTLLIAHAELGPRIARETGIKRDKLNTASLMPWLADQAHARWLAQTVSAENGYQDLTPQRVSEVAQWYLRMSALQAVVGEKVLAARTSVFSLPHSVLWLILVSFLVCMVGISNTMLMSVTERFSEIATMKCLGAMDGFVMQLFVFEAMFQGVAGSLIGVALGLLLAVVRCLFSYGGLVFEGLDIGGLSLIAVLSFVTGIVIAAVAAMWPSWTASRLAPMEAMRVE